MKRKLVSIHEAAETLGVSPQTLLDGVRKAVEASQC
jgi:predicted DNA binding protein